MLRSVGGSFHLPPRINVAYFLKWGLNIPLHGDKRKGEVL